MGASPTKGQKGSAAMLAIKKCAGIAPGVTLKNKLHVGEKPSNRGVLHGFETQGDVTRSLKHGFQYPNVLKKQVNINIWKTFVFNVNV